MFMALVNIKISHYFPKIETKREVKKIQIQNAFPKVFALCLKIAVAVLMSQNSRCIAIVIVL